MQKTWNGTRRWRLAAKLAGAALLLAGAVAAAPLDPVFVAPTADVRNTPHNFSRGGIDSVPAGRLSNVRAAATTGESGVCVFCHTPHASTMIDTAPLWNRSAGNATYTRYTSSSLDANNILEGFTNQPAGSSLLCLSCHDGTLALGNVNVNNAVANPTLALNNTNGGRMPTGSAGPAGLTGLPDALSGFTRLIGTDLTNDHPISVTYNNTLTEMDGELTRMTSNLADARDALTGGILGIRMPGFKPLLPLFPTGPGATGQVQCPTCHDPHLKAEKFLRLSRFQVRAPTGGVFDQSGDQLCLACHPKLGWAESAHANPVTADESYLTNAALRRDFPTPATPGVTANIKVWQAGCLNCHDTHTVQGSRRLLREGVESGVVWSTGDGSFRGGSAVTPADTTSAIENTCYQCHDRTTAGSTRVIGTVAGSTVPDIRTEFGRAVRMPISTTEQMRNKREIHDIVDADLTESPELLGRNNPENRHVECPDCHNPHRLRRASTFYGTSSNTAGSEGAKRTHNAGGSASGILKGADGNVASGVLRGGWGVEPQFGPTSSTWPQLPTGFVVKKGDPGLNTSIDKNKTYLTREYQLCLKCHSNYANSDLAGNFPALGNTAGGTTGSPQQRNFLTRYTNVAAEFGSVRATDPPTSGTDQGEVGNDPAFTPNGSAPSTGNNNHRSWHPVMWPTGRTSRERTNNTATTIAGGAFSNIRAPFNTTANVGYQTMHCSDCHGDASSWTQDTGPTAGTTQGPHGSSNRFLLKGVWEVGNRVNRVNAPGFCGNCHNPTGGNGGFKTGDASHNGQYKKSAPCNFCHIAAPHGWKNKAFLVNLDCVGTEAGMAPGCTAVSGAKYTRAPYYVDSVLRVNNWQSSTNWNSTSNCLGGESGMENNCGEWQ